MRYIVMIMVMALTCLDLRTTQAASPEELDSLRGLPGVRVVIEDIDLDAQADGLSQEAIRTAVELILHSSDIRVLTQSESFKTPPEPHLYVRVAILADNNSGYALSALVELHQRASLLHRPQRKMSTATWSIRSIGIVGRNQIRSVIAKMIEPQVKEFANDFLAANPR